MNNNQNHNLGYVSHTKETLPQSMSYQSYSTQGSTPAEYTADEHEFFGISERSYPQVEGTPKKGGLPQLMMSKAHSAQEECIS